MMQTYPMNHHIWSFHAESEADTHRLGEQFGRILQPDSVIALNGELGAGKTRFVQAVARGLDVIEQTTVNSPTYVLIQEYAGRLTIYHFDTYRLADSDEFLELGAEELFTAGGVCLIEWAERVRDVLPREYLQIEIRVTGPSQRQFNFSARGDKHRSSITQLATAMKD